MFPFFGKRKPEPEEKEEEEETPVPTRSRSSGRSTSSNKRNSSPNPSTSSSSSSSDQQPQRDSRSRSRNRKNNNNNDSSSISSPSSSAVRNKERTTDTSTLRNGLADPLSSPFKPRPVNYTPTPLSSSSSSSSFTKSNNSNNNNNSKNTTTNSSPLPPDVSPRISLSNSKRTKSTSRFVINTETTDNNNNRQSNNNEEEEANNRMDDDNNNNNDDDTNEDRSSSSKRKNRSNRRNHPPVSTNGITTSTEIPPDYDTSYRTSVSRSSRRLSTNNSSSSSPSSTNYTAKPTVLPSSSAASPLSPNHSHHHIVGLHDHIVPEHLANVTTAMDDDELHSNIHEFTQKKEAKKKKSQQQKSSRKNPSSADVYREPGIDSEDEDEEKQEYHNNDEENHHRMTNRGNPSSTSSSSTNRNSTFFRFLNRSQGDNHEDHYGSSSRAGANHDNNDDDPQPPSSHPHSNNNDGLSTGPPRFTNRSRLPLAVVVKREQEKMEPAFEMYPPTSSKSFSSRSGKGKSVPPDTALSINNSNSHYPEEGVRPPTNPNQPSEEGPPPESVILYGPDGQPLPPEQQPSNRPPPKIPCFSCIMFLGCIIGFALTLWKTGGFAPLKENPTLGPSSEALIWGGAKVTSKIVDEHEWWRILSPLWLHAGIIHLFSNMSLLYRYGFQLESTAGTCKFATLYMFSGIFSIIVSAVFAPNSVTVGASGALFGIFGAFLAELIQNWHMVPTMRERLCSLFSLSFSISLNLAIGILPFVDNFAHIGGLIGGILLGFPLLIYLWGGQTLKHRQFVTGVLSTIVFVVIFTITLILLYLGVNGNSFCSWCHYVSCVPSPYWTCPS